MYPRSNSGPPCSKYISVVISSQLPSSKEPVENKTTALERSLAANSITLNTIPEPRPILSIMGSRVNDQFSPEHSPARTRRGSTVDEPKATHHIKQGPAHSKPHHTAGLQRPTRRPRSYPDAQSPSRGVGLETLEATDGQPPGPHQPKAGFREKAKAAKDAINEKIQMSKETVGFIHNLHKRYKELERESAARRPHRPRPQSQAWPPRKRRESCKYDSD